jgi:hypothetical protein
MTSMTEYMYEVLFESTGMPAFNFHDRNDGRISERERAGSRVPPAAIVYFKMFDSEE